MRRRIFEVDYSIMSQPQTYDMLSKSEIMMLELVKRGRMFTEQEGWLYIKNRVNPPGSPPTITMWKALSYAIYLEDLYEEFEVSKWGINQVEITIDLC